MEDPEKGLADLYRAGTLEPSAKTERAIRQAADREFARGAAPRREFAGGWRPALALAAGLVMGIAIHALFFSRSGDTGDPTDIRFETRGAKPIPDWTTPAELRDNPRGWLQWVAEKLNAGEVDTAATALEEFKRRYPEFGSEATATKDTPPAR